MATGRLEAGQQVPRALADARVLGPDSAEIRLGDVWSERDALVVFVRHFACSGCSEHVTELSPRLAELDALGVNVILVGCGAPDQIAAFKTRQRLDDKPLVVTTDPTLGAFRSAGLVRSVWSTVGPLATYKFLRAMLHGHSNDLRQGVAFLQQGGTLLVKKDGTIAFYDRNEHVGDHASVVDVVDVALAIRASESPVSV